MSTDLTNWRDREDYARSCRYGKQIAPTADHVTLLRSASWTWDDCEFGAVAMDSKRPYGNSNVEDDLAELLPHLSEDERLRRHCEMPAVLAYVMARVEPADA